MSHERLSFVHGDIRDASLMRELVANVDVIVNAAAESHVEKSIREGASEFVTTNVEGTQILLDAIRETPVERFILISSSEVYGTAERAPMDEEHPLKPCSPVRGDEGGRRPPRVLVLVHVRAADRRSCGRSTTTGRASIRRRSCRASSRRRCCDEPLTIHGDGHASRDWLYVEDDAEAIAAIIAAPIEQIAGEVLNVATGDRHLRRGRRRRGAGRAREAVLAEGVRRRAAGQVDRHIGTTEKMERLTGWRARTSFDDGLERTVRWYRENEAWWQSVLQRERSVSSS